MVKVLIYAYATGTFSSRKMAKKLEEDVAFRMLAAGNFPKHRTLCEFRAPSWGFPGGVRAEVVLLARKPWGWPGVAGYRWTRDEGSGEREQAQGDELRPDGDGGASPGGGDPGAPKAEIQALVERGEAVDEAEDERYGEEARGDELPDELKRREDRLAAIREAKARLEEEQRAADDARRPQAGTDASDPKGGPPYKRKYGEPDEKAQSNFTDPESRIMKTSTEGFERATTRRWRWRGRTQLVVGADVTDNASDQGQLIPMATRRRRRAARRRRRCWRTRAIATNRTCRR